MKVLDKAKKPKKPEAMFEKAFKHVAELLHCLYVKIPDMIVTRARLEEIRRGALHEHLRPFDGVLVTMKGVYCLEFKYGRNRLSTHQAWFEGIINAIKPNTFYVIRLTEKNDIRIEYAGKVILEDGDLYRIIGYFQLGD